MRATSSPKTESCETAVMSHAGMTRCSVSMRAISQPKKNVFPIYYPFIRARTISAHFSISCMLAYS